MNDDAPRPTPAPEPHRPARRPRYSGKNPRRWEDKYKEHAGDPETLAKVTAGGKTPAGRHRPIMVEEILTSLAPRPGEIFVDGTLGFGGHAQAILPLLLPGGRCVGLDADPLQLPLTESRLRAAGWGPDVLTAIRSNFAGMPQALATAGLPAADLILLDLGVSSMQIDNPDRGFSYKSSGPLDMRMNPQRGQPASAWLKSASAQLLAEILTENADEPHAIVLADALAGQAIPSTDALAAAVRRIVPAADAEKSLMRVFQAIRIAVNDELGALDSFLRVLPACLAPGGRIAILTFHSGEDRRVKKAFEANLATGFFSHVADLQRPGPEEVRANPRAAPAKLRAATRPSL